MIANLLRRFQRDRKGATAVIIALMIVPLLIAAGAAVDFSRVASARAQLQAAVDSAAAAGAGAYQNNTDGTAAYNVANSSFLVGSANSYATISSAAVGTSCNPNSGACGSTSPNAKQATHCGTTYDYCVSVTATATLKNSLLAFIIPTDVLTATSTSLTTTIIGPKNFPALNYPNASDLNSHYAYLVPMTGPNGTPNYDQLPYPSQSCIGPITNGVLAGELAAGASSTTACDYYELGSSTGNVTTPQPPLSPANGQPIAFAFVNITGNTSGYGFTGVGADSGAIGAPVGGAGYCPYWTLYGSISGEIGGGKSIAAVQGKALVPLQDSEHIYSSAYEMYGLPPSYSSSAADEASPGDPNGINQPFGTNQPIIPFQIPAGTDVGTQTTYKTTTYYTNSSGQVSLNSQNGYSPTTVAEDPNNLLYYSYIKTTTTSITGTTSTTKHNKTTTTPVNSSSSTTAPAVYATTSSNSNYTNSSTSVGPTTTENGSTTTKTTTTTTVTYNVSAVNGNGSTTSGDVVTTAVFNCPAQSGWNATYYPSNPYYNAVSGTKGPAVVSGCTPNTSSLPWNYSPSNFGNCANGAGGTKTGQTSNYSNCALLIEPLGALSTPAIPLSWTAGTQTVTVNGTNVTQNILKPNYTSYSGNEYWLPDSTAHKCYDPSAGFDTNTNTFEDTVATAKAYDAIQNPGLGAITCGPLPKGQTSPNSYALYWNDLGSQETDDLGYWNAITLFTCSSPGSGGGPPTEVY